MDFWLNNIWLEIYVLTSKSGGVEQFDLRAGQALFLVFHRGNLYIVIYKMQRTLSAGHLVVCWQSPVTQVLIPPLLEVGQEALEALLTEQYPGVPINNGWLDRELHSDFGDVHLLWLLI